jgi:hypothetical protein
MTSTPKRVHPSTDSESETSLSERPLNKRANMADSAEPVQTALKELFEKMSTLEQRLVGTLATKEDVEQMKENVKSFTGEVLEKLDKIEGQMLELESKTAAVAKEVKVVKAKTNRLEHNINDHDIRVKQLERDMNDLEQYSRRSHLRVYRIPEPANGQKEDVTKKVCDIFTDLVGVRIVPEDIEVAHRSGRVGGKARPVLVRFFDRKKRDTILQNRRKLKGKNIVVDEDLTYLNYKLLKSAQSHSATLSVWSSNGKVLAKLKSGQTMRLNIHSDLDGMFAKAMNGQQDSMQDSSSN